MGTVLLEPGSLLRRILAVDAAASAALAGLLLAGAGPLSTWLSLPEALLLGTGAVLVPFAAVLAWMLRRRQVPRALVWAVIVANALWAADSIVLAASDWIGPNTAGMAFVTGQALGVAAFAELEWLGLRRSRAPAMAPSRA